MTLALLVARFDLLRRIRNRSALVTAFIGPMALAVVFSMLIGGTESASFRIGIADADGSSTSRAIVDGLLSARDTGPVRFEQLATPAVAEDRVDGDTVDAAIVIPAGFEAAATAGRPTSLTVLRSPDRVVSGQVGAAVAQRVAQRFDLVALTVRAAATRVGGVPPASLIPAAQRLAEPIPLAEAAPGGHELSPAAFFGASMSILFLFFTVGFAARSLVAEHRAGTLGRLLATPLSPGALIAGKTLSVAALGLTGFVTVWAITSVVFGAHWGAPLKVLAVMVATVFAIGGVSTFVAALASTERQADAYTAGVTFALALLGGNFINPGAAPPLLHQLGRLTPNGWALQAFSDLATDDATLGALLPALGVLGAIGLASGAIGVTRIRRLVAA